MDLEIVDLDFIGVLPCFILPLDIGTFDIARPGWTFDGTMSMDYMVAILDESWIGGVRFG